MSAIHILDYQNFLETEKSLKTGDRFDIAIIGSDEVFNATAYSSWGFTTQLFGKIDNANKVVTYAASCGSTTLEKAREYGIVEEIRLALENVQALSVRDNNTYAFVKGITGKDAEIHVDPVFLADYDEYIQKPKKTKPYLLVYAYANRIKDKAEIQEIKAYAKQKKLQIISVGMQQRWCSHNIAANAFELLGYFKNAACVVTDTFHGTVFSIKYNKKFVSLIRENNKQKLGGLLQYFGIYNRAVLSTDKLEQVMDSVLDYESINKRIVIEQKKSKKYLDRICEMK